MAYTEVDDIKVIEHDGSGFVDESSFYDLDPAVQGVLLDWIAQRLNPARKVNENVTTERMREVFTRDTGVHVHRGEFKSAMLVAGYKPYNEQKIEWKFRISKDADRYEKPAELLAQIPPVDVWEIDNLLAKKIQGGYQVKRTLVECEDATFTPQEAVHWYKVVCKFASPSRFWPLWSIEINDSRSSCRYCLQDEEYLKIVELELPEDIVKEAKYDQDISERECDKS